MDLIDFHLKHPFVKSVVGPTGSGKSYYIIDLIRNRRSIIDIPIEKVVYVYYDFQPMFYELQLEDPNIIFTNRLEDIETLVSDPCLLIIDDQMDTISKGWANDLVTRLFIKSSHHKGVSTIVVLQNAFEKSLRTVNVNSQYLVMFDQARDRSVITNLGKQICPGHVKFLQESYQKAVESREFGYLFMDFHPKNKRYKYWLRSNLYPTEDCEIYSS